jgi:hypothetical protein
MWECTGFTAASLEHLLSTSVQGCCLRISLEECKPEATEEACADLRSRVLAQRGSRDTPALSASIFQGKPTTQPSTGMCSLVHLNKG